MTTEEKNRFDAISALMKSAWESTDHRRTFEWKVSLGLWTAFAGFVGLILGQQPKLASHAYTLGVAVIAISVTILHCLWLAGIARANDIDKSMMHYFRDQAMALVAIQTPKDVQTKIDSLNSRRSRYFDWSQTFQAGITLLLGVAAVLTVWNAVGG